MNTKVLLVTVLLSFCGLSFANTSFTLYSMKETSSFCPEKSITVTFDTDKLVNGNSSVVLPLKIEGHDVKAFLTTSNNIPTYKVSYYLDKTRGFLEIGGTKYKIENMGILGPMKANPKEWFVGIQGYHSDDPNAAPCVYSTVNASKQ